METFRRGQGYTKRFGVDFPELISIVIDSYMPLCAPLARYHFGLGDEPSPRLINPLESRWLENLAKGPLEGSLKQLSQLNRFGSKEDEMKAALRTREKGHGPLKAIFNQMRSLQDKWLIVASARSAAYLKYPAPNKPALNALMAQWAVASAREIERLDGLGYEFETGRTQAKRWVQCTLEGDWRLAVEAFELAPVPHEDDPPKAHAYFALSCSILACIYGRWSMTLSPIYDAFEALNEEVQLLEATGKKVPANLRGAVSWLEIAVSAALQLIEHITPPEARDPFEVGLTLGTKPWTIIDRLGVELWLAESAQGTQSVLEEVWPRGDEAWSTQTQREALILSTMQHEHIAPCIDWGVDPVSKRWFLAYPLIYGESLRQKIEESGPLSEAQTRAYMLQVIEALKHALKQDIYHRQLTADSILFFSEERIVVTRWGVHRTGIPGWRYSSDQGQYRRRFIAPERLDRAIKSVEDDAKADIYAVGALLAYMLSPDFDLRVPDAVQSLPLAFQPIVKKALAPDPKDRYQDIGVLERELFNLKPRYNYRGEYGERDSLLLTQVVGLIISKPKGLHSIWQPHLSDWRPWREVDEIAQLVEAALAAQAQEKQEVDVKNTEVPLPERRKAQVPKTGATQLGQAVHAPQIVTPMFSKPEIPGTSQERVICGVLFKLSYVPPGDHSMGQEGSDPLTFRSERPQHVVSISRPLWVGQTPVTQAQYAALTGINPSYTQGWQLPVDQVSWIDAARYCNLLSELEGLPAVYIFEVDQKEDVEKETDLMTRSVYDEPEGEEDEYETSHVDLEADLDEGESEEPQIDEDNEGEEISEAVRALLFEEEGQEVDARKVRRAQLSQIAEAPREEIKVHFNLNSGGYRLLTEAEWEYAASAGRPTEFAGSDQWKEVGWFSENSQDMPHPVGQKQPNAWSLYDMSGSVWEWCSDEMRTYTRHVRDPHFGAQGSSDVRVRALRGGSWRRSKIFARVKARSQGEATLRRRQVGFRIARPLLPVDPSLMNTASKKPEIKGAVVKLSES